MLIACGGKTRQLFGTNGLSVDELSQCIGLFISFFILSEKPAIINS